MRNLPPMYFCMATELHLSVNVFLTSNLPNSPHETLIFSQITLYPTTQTLRIPSEL